MNRLNRIISVAPMMDYTDKHERYFLRLIAPHVLLYTEMITTNALLRGDRLHLLAYHAHEHPLALQLGGADPKSLADCAKIGENFGFDEINLNVGCPSDRVKQACFGACLMLEPKRVADAIAEMVNKVSIPVTVKCRIGVDELDSYTHLRSFIELIHQAGCKVFIIHARKAWLSGLSPKENRDIPPLRYDVVYQLKQDFPHLQFILNGGVKTLEDVDLHLRKVDGVMIGRAAYQNPYTLRAIDEKYYGGINPYHSREAILDAYTPYVSNQLRTGVRLARITRHLLGLYQGQKGASIWRRYLSEHAHLSGVGTEVIHHALAAAMSK